MWETSSQENLRENLEKLTGKTYENAFEPEGKLIVEKFRGENLGKLIGKTHDKAFNSEGKLIVGNLQ